MDRVSLKNAAKAQIKGNIGVLFVCYIIFIGIAIISWLFSLVTLGIATLLVVPPFLLGFAIIYLGMFDGAGARIEKLFAGFKANFVKAILLYILIAIFVFLWSLLLVIPGIVKAYSY